MFADLRAADEIPGLGLESLPDAVLSGGRPTVLRGAVREWPFVRAAIQSDELAARYINRFYTGRAIDTIIAPPSERGRFFYQRDSKSMNFERSSQSLTNILQGVLQQREVEHPFGIAVQAIAAPEILPGLQEENPNSLIASGIPARLWIGNRVTIAPHFDVADNLACVVAGRRRFFLFPPDQTRNLYPGPIDVTPAGYQSAWCRSMSPSWSGFPVTVKLSMRLSLPS